MKADLQFIADFVRIAKLRIIEIDQRLIEIDLDLARNDSATLRSCKTISIETLNLNKRIVENYERYVK
jgi:hypothetical protein